MRASQSCGIEGKQLGGSAESRGELLRSRECERAKVQMRRSRVQTCKGERGNH